MIVVDDVSVTAEGPAGEMTILDGVSCTLTEHRVGIIGDNGSGKSTLLKLIDGLVEPSRGRVTVDGFDTVRQGREVRRRVGYVFTEALAQLLMPTPVEDVELSLRASVRDRTARTAAAQSWLDRWEVGHVARRSVYDISGGERQLVALVSVLAVEPAIVLADEPTTLLDLTNRLRLRETFRGLTQQLVVATHDLGFAADMDRVLVLAEGRIVYDGAAADAIAYYRELARETAAR